LPAGFLPLGSTLPACLLLVQGTTLTEIEEGCGASLIVDDGGTINVYASTQVSLTAGTPVFRKCSSSCE